MVKLVKLYIANLTNISLNEILVKYKDYIHKDDIDNMNDFEIELKKMQSITSSILKNKYVLGPIYYSEFGKPLSNNSYFNISHSDNLVILAITEDVNIGIDIEHIRDVKDKTILYTLNSLELDTFDYENKTKSFYTLWTKKEAIAKCYGIGLTKNIKDILTNYNNYIESFYIDDYVYSIALECNKDTDINIISNIEF